MSTSETRTVSVTIERPWREVYEFAAIPMNFQRWASGLGGSLKEEAGRWTAQAPEGPVTIRFSEQNDFGVLDHWVTLEDGTELYIPLRVIANGTGAEVSLTIFRAGRSDQVLADDEAWVARDLDALRHLLEA